MLFHILSLIKSIVAQISITLSSWGEEKMMREREGGGQVSSLIRFSGLFVSESSFHSLYQRGEEDERGEEKERFGFQSYWDITREKKLFFHNIPRTQNKPKKKSTINNIKK